MTTIESRPEPPRAKPRAPRGARVAGYLVAVAINVAFIWLVNVAPGWRWLPLLSDDFSRVVGLVTLSLVVSVLVNLVYIAIDPRWMRRLGDALTAAVAFVVMLRLLQVFPFDFDPPWAWLQTPCRVLLILGCVGAAIGVIANLAMAARDLATGTERG